MRESALAAVQNCSTLAAVQNRVTGGLVSRGDNWLKVSKTLMWLHLKAGQSCNRESAGLVRLHRDSLAGMLSSVSGTNESSQVTHFLLCTTAAPVQGTFSLPGIGFFKQVGSWIRALHRKLDQSGFNRELKLGKEFCQWKSDFITTTKNTTVWVFTDGHAVKKKKKWMLV